jgi:hypothetical protein
VFIFISPSGNIHRHQPVNGISCIGAEVDDRVDFVRVSILAVQSLSVESGICSLSR